MSKTSSISTLSVLLLVTLSIAIWALVRTYNEEEALPGPKGDTGSKGARGPRGWTGASVVVEADVP